MVNNRVLIALVIALDALVAQIAVIHTYTHTNYLQIFYEKSFLEKNLWQRICSQHTIFFFFRNAVCKYDVNKKEKWREKIKLHANGNKKEIR